MKPVPRKAKDEEDSITELKKQTEERPIIKQQEAPDTCCATKEAPKEEAKEAAKENGYLTVIKNVPFLCVMLANLPAVMGLYIPYMFLPGVSAVGVAASQTCKRCFTMFGIESASLIEGTFSTLGIEASLQNSLFLDVFQFPECSEYSEASLTCLGHTYFADIYIAIIAPLFQLCRQSYAKVQTLTLDLKQRFSPLPVSLHKRQVLTARCVQITQQRGLSEADSALLISLIGFFNTGGRIVSGAITDHPRVDALFLTTLAIFSGDTSSVFMWRRMTSYNM